MPHADDQRKNPLLRALDGPFVLGAACTIGYYAYMLTPGMKGTLLHRYTTEHLVDYVIVSLFFWGLIDVLAKLLAFPREIMALRADWLPERAGREDAASAPSLLAGIAAMPPAMRASLVGKRLTRALEYVVENGATPEYRVYLQTLSDRDADRSHANYTLIRFVVRVTPVLGFLGTVVHFGTALNGIDFEHMADKLGVVVSEMGQAFNTTTVALAAAMFMMFAQFICEWSEKSILTAVDRLAQRDLFNRFEVQDANIPPLLGVVKTANSEALRLIAAGVERQSGVWTQALDALMSRFDQRQRQEAEAWNTALEALAARHEDYDAVREERLRQMLDVVDGRQEKILEHIETTLEKALAVRDDFRTLGKTIEGLARGEGQLVELQGVLTDNLRAIHETQKFDDALHGLTAAIHLLTARHQPTEGRGKAA
jgi:biopolymer transport protein ExbB/TolQ